MGRIYVSAQRHAAVVNTIKELIAKYPENDKALAVTYTALYEHYRSYGYMPSRKELAVTLRRGENAIFKRLEHLRRAGYLKIPFHKARIVLITALEDL